MVQKTCRRHFLTCDLKEWDFFDNWCRDDHHVLVRWLFKILTFECPQVKEVYSFKEIWPPAKINHPFIRCVTCKWQISLLFLQCTWFLFAAIAQQSLHETSIATGQGHSSKRCAKGSKLQQCASHLPPFLEMILPKPILIHDRHYIWLLFCGCF